ncbi:hypothetical protein AB0O34_05255 [Sphaerisporangium sp. NPDC088356]
MALHGCAASEETASAIRRVSVYSTPIWLIVEAMPIRLPSSSLMVRD